jgi:hypothetical protein
VWPTLGCVGWDVIVFGYLSQRCPNPEPWLVFPDEPFSTHDARQGVGGALSTMAAHVVLVGAVGVLVVGLTVLLSGEAVLLFVAS